MEEAESDADDDIILPEDDESTRGIKSFFKKAFHSRAQSEEDMREIGYEDDNDYDSPEIDSKQGNDKKGEDDEDDAPVIITTATGSAQIFITLALVSVSIIAGGVILIKKFVIE